MDVQSMGIHDVGLHDLGMHNSVACKALHYLGVDSVNQPGAQ